MRPGRRRRSTRAGLLRTSTLFVLAVMRSFRYTLGFLFAAVLCGTIVYSLTPLRAFDGQPPPLHAAIYAAWMTLFAQPIQSPPEPWYLELMAAVYPIFGFILVGDGVVRLSLLLISRAHGEKDWMKVMASVYRDHVVLCGLGHLGSRILSELCGAGVDVVALERDPQGRFIPEAKATGAPILLRDMKDDEALCDAGVPHARCIIIATNDDIANLEVALDARRLNPEIRVVMRMFDQQIADKIKDAFAVDQAFSSAALAAPLVAAIATAGAGGGVLSSFIVAGAPHMTAEVVVQADSRLDGSTVGDLEREHGARVVARVPAEGAADPAPSASARIHAGDRVVVSALAERIEPIFVAAGVVAGIAKRKATTPTLPA